MLARKYYSQRGHSKGVMNTNAPAQSSSSRTKQLSRSVPVNVKRMPDRSSGENTEKTKSCVLINGSASGNNPQYSSGVTCAVRQNSNPESQVSIIKEQTGKLSQSDYLKTKVTENICNNDDFWGKIIPTNNCAHA